MAKVICITGKARAGKTTFCEVAKKELETKYGKKVIVFHFADFLKFIAGKWFGYDGDKTKPEMRSLLQKLGTDVFRKNNPGCWVDMANSFVKGLGDEVDYVLVGDCRFINEAEWADAVIRVLRPGFDNGLTPEQKAHPSEAEQDHIEADLFLMNDGTLEDYEKKVRGVCRSIVDDNFFDIISLI